MSHRTNRWVGTYVVAAALGLASAEARAESIDFLGLGRHSTVSVDGPVSGTFFAGELLWAWQGTPPDGFASTFYTYCIDILTTLADPQDVDIRATDELTPANAAGVSDDAGAKAAWLVNTYAPGVASGLEAAALQVAVWEAVYDSSQHLDAGTFSLQSSTSPAIRDQADTYLLALYSSALATGGAGYYTSDAVWLDTVGGQDQMVAVVAVAEPATAALFGAGCLLVVWRSRRQA